MDLILKFLVDHMKYLWDGAKFRIVGSLVGDSNGGDAQLYVESEFLRLIFTCDRRQLTLELCRAKPEGKRESVFSIDLVRRHFTGISESSGLLDTGYAEFLSNNIVAIEQMFSPGRYDSTKSELKSLARVRAKEMFG